MTFSHRSYEGELLSDNRASGGRRIECPTMPCCGCQKVMIVNPNRQRPRDYCRRHDAYMCESCTLLVKLGHKHEGFTEFADRYLNAAATGKELPKWPNE